MTWNNLLTGRDNETHDIARVLCVLIILVALGLVIYDVVFKGGKFDIVTYGAGMGQILAATGIFIKLKENSEPPSKETPP